MSNVKLFGRLNKKQAVPDESGAVWVHQSDGK